MHRYQQKRCAHALADHMNGQARISFSNIEQDIMQVGDHDIMACPVASACCITETALVKGHHQARVGCVERRKHMSKAPRVVAKPMDTQNNCRGRILLAP